MTIYATPYDPNTKQVTGASVDSGLESLDDVADVFGPAAVGGAHWLGYPNDGMVYSDFVFDHTDATVTNTEA